MFWIVKILFLQYFMMFLLQRYLSIFFKYLTSLLLLFVLLSSSRAPCEKFTKVMWTLRPVWKDKGASAITETWEYLQKIQSDVLIELLKELWRFLVAVEQWCQRVEPEAVLPWRNSFTGSNKYQKYKKYTLRN